MYNRKAHLIAFLAVIWLLAAGSSPCQDGSADSVETIEFRDRRGKVITTVGTRDRGPFLVFANAVARQYGISMHTHQLADGIAIQFGRRTRKGKRAHKPFLDREIEVTVRNGRRIGRFHFSEHELNFRQLSRVWDMMGYHVGVSSGGDRCTVRRETYVPPELPAAHQELADGLVSAIVSRDAARLASLFAPVVHFPTSGKMPSGRVTNQEEARRYLESGEMPTYDHISNEEAARRFLEEYPADRVEVCSYGWGVEGQLTLTLAGQRPEQPRPTSAPADDEWFLHFWTAKAEGPTLVSQFAERANFWLSPVAEP